MTLSHGVATIVTLSHGVVVIMTTQAKEGLYYDCYSMDMFLSFAIEVFMCHHQQFNNFLHQCANKVWTTKCTGGPPFIDFALLL
jgi:hypothetical protein